MPKLILRCNYLKNSPPAHLANYINYIGTREGVEKVASTTSSHRPAEKSDCRYSVEDSRCEPDA